VDESPEVWRRFVSAVKKREKRRADGAYPTAQKLWCCGFDTAMLTTLQSEEPMFFTKFHHGSFVYQGFYDADEEAGCLLLVCRPPRSLSVVDLTSANTKL
jgi:hypothetical protein